MPPSPLHLSLVFRLVLPLHHSLQPRSVPVVFLRLLPDSQSRLQLQPLPLHHPSLHVRPSVPPFRLQLLLFLSLLLPVPQFRHQLRHQPQLQLQLQLRHLQLWHLPCVQRPLLRLHPKWRLPARAPQPGREEASALSCHRSQVTWLLLLLRCLHPHRLPPRRHHWSSCGRSNSDAQILSTCSSDLTLEISFGAVSSVSMTSTVGIDCSKSRM
mmetsp:Transcript_11953/g.38226  ORF Transcript_11953/g.38226 Transcript_11953/m.38226 type:complete len:212 (+) Transcript_11953:293-928(+)